MRPYAKHIGVFRYEEWTVRELYEGEGDKPDEALMALAQQVVAQELDGQFDDPMNAGFYILRVTEKHHNLVLACWHEGAGQVVIRSAEKQAGDAKYEDWLEYPYPRMQELIIYGIEAALWEAHYADGALDVEAWANAPHALPA
jgi:hypothetical protein